MSKKSRRRNKKILAALALAGGAAMLAKGRGKGAATSVPLNPNLQKTIAADAGSDIAAEVAAPVVTGDSGYLSRMSGAGDKATQLKNQIKRANFAQRGRYVNPHEATAAAGAAYTPHPYDRDYSDYENWRGKGGGIAKRGTGAAYKSGGRVTGIAKRGFGRALMKGKK